jgi:DNA-directed RNA polymerase specialized sigma24 family protein
MTNHDLEPHAPAWAWILSHSTLIERFAWKFVRGTSLTHDDFRAELIADLAAIFPRFDPHRASPSTWIWMRAAKVRRTMVRAAVRGSAAPLLDELDEVPVGGHGSNSRGEARAEVVCLLDRATPHQRMAALSVMRGWDRDEVRRRLGCSLRERDAIVRSLGGA